MSAVESFTITIEIIICRHLFWRLLLQFIEFGVQQVYSSFHLVYICCKLLLCIYKKERQPLHLCGEDYLGSQNHTVLPLLRRCSFSLHLHTNEVKTTNQDVPIYFCIETRRVIEQLVPALLLLLLKCFLSKKGLGSSRYSGYCQCAVY